MNRLKINRAYMSYILIGLILVTAAWWLLGTDFFSFMAWWEMVWLLGLVFMPLSSKLFSKFDDKGWMFSKVIGIAVCGYAVWLMTVTKLVPFNGLSCILITIACAVLNLFISLKFSRKEKEILPFGQGNLIFMEEALFFVLFLVWSYMAGFHPAAHGTEKFMDFGFMQAIMKSSVLPPEDLWYAGEPLNYYYGGQYYAVFLTKLTGTSVEITYNLMRTLVAAFAFILPFSIVRQMLCDRMSTESRVHPKSIAAVGGLLAGCAVSLSGNMHYIIYGKVIPLINQVMGKSTQDNPYWFSDSTRYIGHNPVVNDETIHEFPSYSFILGDLHAHVINVFFVLTIIGILYAWLGKNEGKSWRQPVVVICGMFLGIFQFSNTWDFAIYYVVICATLFFGNLKRYSGRMRDGIRWSAVQWAEVLAMSVAVSLPFHLHFNSNMVQGIALCQNHSPFYQLCVLWALPVLICGSFLIQYLKNIAGKKFGSFMEWTHCADMYASILALCAIGLICIPELVYIRDIYEKNAARANTMFKLTYQAYILFSLIMAYILVRFITNYRCRLQVVLGIVMTCLLVSTFGYMGTAVKAWFYNFPDKNYYKKLNAVRYLEEELPCDASAINWINQNIEGRPVMLEADGESYKDYDNRVSAMTGLPTVLGWYVHEWLWRDDLEKLNIRSEDVKAIYTSDNKETARALLDKYGVSYIFVGSCEYSQYENINIPLLKSLGNVVFQQEHVMDFPVNSQGTEAIESRTVNTMIIKVE